MHKLALLGAVLVTALTTTSAAVAKAPIQRVDDPTPNGQFTGTYDCSYHTYDSKGNAKKVERTCSQKGHVAVYSDGVVICNGNQDLKRPDTNESLNGFIWVGPAHAAKTPTGAAPMNAAGAGKNTAADDPKTKDKDEAQGPCEDPTPPKG